MGKLKPVIKWSGSKRSQSEQILKQIPNKVDHYIEPFIGGGSILGSLLKSENHSVGIVEVSDLNNDLISLWKCIKSCPEEVYSHYKKLWLELKSQSSMDNKKEYFYKVRERLNKEHDPLDFMFIMRTCVNGMPRYNSSGKFNTSYHLNRDGINPETLKGILEEWSYLLTKNNVEFYCRSYEDVVSEEGSFLYLDPPYGNTKGMYFDNFEVDNFFNWVRGLEGNYLLSFDGKSGKEDNTWDVPKDVYREHIYLESGNSSFKRLKCEDKYQNVQESLYIK